MIENEFKLLVSETTFINIQDKVANYYSELPPLKKIQINYYYDTSNFDLNKQNITLRARVIKNKITLQLKILEKVVEQSKRSFEYKKRLEFIPDTIESYMLPINIDGRFNLIGSLITDRTSFFISDNIRIDFDKNSYLNKIDYEIEIEYDKDSPLDIINSFTEGLPIHKPIGKYSRFLELLKIQRNEIINNEY